MKKNILKLVNIDIPYSDAEYGRCYKFVKDVMPTTSGYINSRAQYNEDKKFDDHLNGKLGENAAYKYMNPDPSKSPVCSAVDYEVTETKKSFNADLKLFNGQGVHVKSRHIDFQRKWSASWTFGYSDKYGNSSGHYDKEIFDNPESDDLCIFCTVHTDKAESYVTIRAVVSVSVLHKYNLFDAPDREDKNGIKKCVYYDRLVEVHNAHFYTKP